MVLLYFLLVLFSSIAISAIGNSLVLNFAKTLGIRNKNNITVRWSNESKPSLGGVSMFLVFVVSGFVVSILLNEELQLIKNEYLGFLLASSAAFAMGISDDAYDTKPWFKLLIQITCGVIFVFSDITIDLFNQPILDALITILWVVILMNSLNMLDNMDGIAGTVTLFVLISCLLVLFVSSGFFISIWSLLLIACVGTMIGFLIYNIHPSKLFMGDGGSQFTGVIVAFFTIKTLFHANESIGTTSWLGPCLALVALTPAAADTLTVVINRLKAGRSPMVGGKDHTTHHLVYSGKSDSQVWKVFLGLSILSSVMTVLLYILAANSTMAAGIIGIVYFLSVFSFLHRKTIKYQQKA
jgi:UDP-GlcNAc:undecaprenyl-phosphate GlcNAc-1-phosphate transferase